MQPIDPPTDLFADLASNVPIALMPLRLETRFGTRIEPMDDGGGVTVDTLRVRIYPDEITIAVSAPGLRRAEGEAGRNFWAAQQQLDGEDPGAFLHRRTAAWEVLVQHVGVQRAVLVARGTKDGEPDDGEAAPAGPGAVPAARLLPRAWVIVGEVDGTGGFVHYVQRTTDSLQVGPTNTSKPFDVTDSLLFPVDDQLRWISDFDAAVSVGMAAEIDLQTIDQAVANQHSWAATHGLSALYVLGVYPESPENTASEVNDLLATHAAASAMSFLAQGAPTNNLDGAPSGWSATADPFAGYRWVTEPADAAPALSDTVPALHGGATDGTILESAFGLPAGAVSAVPGAAGSQQWLARNMARALYPVAFGEAIGTLSTRKDSAAADSPEALAMHRKQQAAMVFAREHISSFVRAGGPVTGLRVGRNPYGILPVMARRGWVRQGGEEPLLEGLVGILDSLRFYFDRAAGSVPRLEGSAQPDITLHNILSMSPVPHEGGYQVQDVIGQLASHIMAVDVYISPALATELGIGHVAAPTGAFAAELSESTARRIVALGFGDLMLRTNLEDMRLSGTKQAMQSWVAHTDPGRPGWASPSDYLLQLVNRYETLREFWVQNATPPDDLLYILVERALALAGELDGGLLLLAINPGLSNLVAKVPIELVGTSLPAESARIQAMARPLAQMATEQVVLADSVKNQTVEEVAFTATDELESMLRTLSPELSRFGTINTLSGTRDAVRVLAQAGIADKEGKAVLDDNGYTRLAGEALACASTRLDAWATSLATARLANLREETPEGLLAGAWGVLFDVRPEPAADVAADENGVGPQRWRDHLASHGLAQTPRLRQPEGYVGYVHAPSLAQAVTAGILRSGELAHHGDGSSVASMDLTSKRVRTGLDIVAAMSHGQPLGALLGYQLERALHQDRLHNLVARLREQFPQRRTTGAVGEAVSGDDAVVPAEVVDGLEVWKARDQLGQAAGMEGLSGALAELNDTVEAVADLIVANGVHQIATGRGEVAGAAFTAVAEGRTPPEVTVAAEPRSGLTITHRLMLTLGADDGHGQVAAGIDGQGWNATAPRALLAPAAERWAQSVLGDAANYAVQRPDLNGVAGDTIPLTDLNLCALDVVAESIILPSGEPALAARCHAPEALLELARSAAEVLGASRPAVSADLSWPPRTDQGIEVGTVAAPLPPGPAELAGVLGAIADTLRVANVAIDAIHAAVDGLGAAAPGVAGATVDAALLDPLAALGVHGAVVGTLDAPGGGMPAAQVAATTALAAASAAEAMRRDVFRLLEQGQPTAATGAAAGLAAIAAVDSGSWETALANTAYATTSAATVAKITRRLGGDPVVPSFAVVVPDAAVVSVDAGGLHRWLTRMSRIRPATARFDEVCLFGEAAGRPPVALAALHLPPTKDLAWLGGPLAGQPDQKNPLRRWIRPEEPHTHVVLAGAAAAPGAAIHALVLDEISEVLPAPTVNTGLALHYNAPNARAPQSVLLAVHPDPASPWSWQLLHRTLSETMDWVRLRGVDLDDLAPNGIRQYLPLAYVRDDEGLSPLENLTAIRIWQKIQVSANRLIEGILK